MGCWMRCNGWPKFLTRSSCGWPCVFPYEKCHFRLVFHGALDSNFSFILPHAISVVNLLSDSLLMYDFSWVCISSQKSLKSKPQFLSWRKHKCQLHDPTCVSCFIMCDMVRNASIMWWQHRDLALQSTFMFPL